jgi:hypothetical protein
MTILLTYHFLFARSDDILVELYLYDEEFGCYLIAKCKLLVTAFRKSAKSNLIYKEIVWYLRCGTQTYQMTLLYCDVKVLFILEWYHSRLWSLVLWCYLTRLHRTLNSCGYTLSNIGMRVKTRYGMSSWLVSKRLTFFYLATVISLMLTTLYLENYTCLSSSYFLIIKLLFSYREQRDRLQYIAKMISA